MRGAVKTEDEIVEAMVDEALPVFRDKINLLIAWNGDRNAMRMAMHRALAIALPWAREQVLADRDDAAANAKEFRAATERACDEAIVRYKHEARTAREQALREAAETAHKWAIHGSDYRPSVVTEIEALIPARPSQGTAEG